MSKLRVHELARELRRQNREVIEFLKSKGVDVRSHMSMVDEPAVSEVKNRFRKDNNNRGKEHIAKLETPKTEEKVVTAKSEGDKTHNKISDLSCLLNIWKDTYGWNFLINVIIALIIAAKFGKNDTKK